MTKGLTSHGAGHGTIVSSGSTKLSKRIGWLNSQGGLLSQPIMFKDVGDLLGSLGDDAAMKLLKDLEDKGTQVNNPTAYLKKAAQNALVGGQAPQAQHVPPPEAYVQQVPYAQPVQYAAPGAPMAGGDPLLPDKIRRRVGWLNSNAGLAALLNYEQIVGHLSVLGDKQAMDVLKRLEESAAEVRDPTGYVIAAAKRTPPAQVTYPTQAYPPQGYPPQAYPEQAYPPQAYPPQAYLPQASAYPPQMAAVGYPPQGMMMDPRAAGVKGVIKTGLKVKHDAGAQAELAGKVKKRVNWLNGNAGLKQPLSFEKVSGLLSALDHAQAMSILKDLETKAESVNDPTGYVIVAARRAAESASSAAGYGVASMGPPPAMPGMPPGVLGVPMPIAGMAGGVMDPQADERLRKKIGWLNTNVTLASPLMYNKVSPYMAQVDPTEQINILKKLEENAATVRDPTGWVIGASQKAGATKDGAQGPVSWPSQMVVTQSYAQQPYAAQTAAQTDERLRKRIGWLNSNAQLLGELRYDQAAPLLSSLDPNQAMEILKHLEENAASVNDPTGWVTSAARRALTQQAAGSAGSPQSQQIAAQTQAMQVFADEKLRKRIGWLNQNAGLQAELSYQKAGPQLLRLTSPEAMAILKQLEDNAPNIPEPNSWVIQAAMGSPSYGSTSPPAGRGGSSFSSDPGNTSLEERLRKRMSWLNAKVALASPLDPEALLPTLLSLDIVRAMAVLKNLENSAATTPDPNAYVEAAAQQAGAEAMASGAGSADYSPPAWTSPPTSSSGANFWTPAGTHGLEEALRQRIDWINSNVPLAEPIVPDQVAPVLACLDLGQALEVLRSVEDNAASLQSPNAHIVAAAQGFA